MSPTAKIQHIINNIKAIRIKFKILFRCCVRFSSEIPSASFNDIETSGRLNFKYAKMYEAIKYS